jgi:hypothetical protein
MTLADHCKCGHPVTDHDEATAHRRCRACMCTRFRWDGKNPSPVPQDPGKG